MPRPTSRLPAGCISVGPGKRPKKIEGYPFWSDHFVFPGKITLNLPTGFYTFELERGPEYYNVTGNFTIERFADDSKEVELRRVVDMSDEGWWSGDLHLRRDIRDMELIASADDLHVAQAVTWWNDKNDLSGKTLVLPKTRLVTFDHDRVYELYCGGFTRAGTEVLCFHLPGPMPLHAQSDEYPSLAMHPSTGPAEGQLGIMGRCPGELRLGPADARGQRAGRLDRGRQRPFRPQGDAARREARKAARCRALWRPFRLCPLVAGRLLQAAGLRLADSAHRRQRFRRLAQSGRLQPGLCASG